MNTQFIKNIPHERSEQLLSEVQYMPGQVVSKTLAQNGAVSLTLFAFEAGEEISAHDSSGDAMIYLLEGKAIITIADKQYELNAGDYIVMPARKKHAVYAEERFKMLLTVIFSSENK